MRELACEIGLELVGGFAHGCGGAPTRTSPGTELDPHNAGVVAVDPDRTDGRCDQGMVARIHERSVGQGVRPAQAEKSQ